MGPNPGLRAALTLILLLSLGFSSTADAARRRAFLAESVGFQLFTSPQVNPVEVRPDGAFAYAVHTTANRVAVINTANHRIVKYVDVGVDPVSVAARPDGLEIWVSNHVSDTVSVIDTDPTSPTYHEVVETIQDLDASGVTQFDEPVGIAFASNQKAYVALSSRNDIAIVDVATYAVTGRIHVTAQEPRAIAVRNGLLYVAPFETGNKTELSACSGNFGSGIVGDQCSLGLTEIGQFVTDPNIPGAVKNIVVDPDVPDRDLYVYDTGTDALVDVVSGVGTLLYGLAVSSTGQAYVTLTDARNAENGNHGLELVDLDNRLFDDEVARVTCTAGGGCGGVTAHALPPGPPGSPVAGDTLSTPYGIAISGDDQVLVGTSAGNSRLFTMDAAGNLLATLDLNGGPLASDFGQQIPRGVGLLSDGAGAPQTAYVLNTLANTISVVDVSVPAAPVTLMTRNLFGDRTPDDVRLGRIAFNNSHASTSGTFSCGSCHPDGNTDQLLWRIGGACFFGACDGTAEPRTTQPIRGLKNTVPLHWDGTLGDPFDNTDNGAFGSGSPQAGDCTLGDADGDHDCFVDLVDEALAGVMCDQNGACPLGGNELDATERDNMATFLASVAYPPARSRRMDETISLSGQGVNVGGIGVSALEGFRDFFTDRGGVGDPNTCADGNSGCHELPLTAGESSETLAGFDAPTMRGLTDRWLQFSLGTTNPEEMLTLANAGLNVGIFQGDPLEAPIQWDPNQGQEEITVFGGAFIVFQGVYNVRPLDIFQMVEEASTGVPGATGRQVTLNDRTLAPALIADTEGLLTALEQADAAGLVNLRVVGLVDQGSGPVLKKLSWRTGESLYRSDDDTEAFTHAALVSLGVAGDLVATATANLRSGYGSVPQPLLAPDNLGGGATGNPDIPHITGGGSPAAFPLAGTDVRSDAVAIVDGVVASGTVSCSGGIFDPECTSGLVSIDLVDRPSNGLHVLQVRNGAGPLSNEIPLCVGNAGGC